MWPLRFHHYATSFSRREAKPEGHYEQMIHTTRWTNLTKRTQFYAVLYRKKTKKQHDCSTAIPNTETREFWTYLIGCGSSWSHRQRGVCCHHHSAGGGANWTLLLTSQVSLKDAQSHRKTILPQLCLHPFISLPSLVTRQFLTQGS